MITATDIAKSYVPEEHEPGITARWEAAGVGHVEPGVDPKDTYSILIPPPNVTAALHLGHAFNNSLQDALIRFHRMKGLHTMWMPGTDHAGIATQTVVEKRLLQEEGRKRTDFERDEFVGRVQEWKDEYEATITEQLKAMGASCDWARQRFTMDDMCVKAVRTAFFELFRDGLIYRGKRLVNWDPVTQTALADDEVEMREVTGHFWYLKYPVVEERDGAWAETGEHVTVATTRPETMLGDTGVAVNPNDAERAAFVGRMVKLPIVGRVIPVVADDYVVIPDSSSDDPKAQYASGFLKVTPAHDANDWDIGQRHDLEAINIMAPDASISDRHGWEDASDECAPVIGLARDDARAWIVNWFKEHGLLADTRDYSHSVGHSYRSHAPIEPYLSDQWYVRVSDDRLVGEAQRALADDQYDGEKPARQHGDPVQPGDGELRFSPARYARTYQSWHDNLRDWCISRQLWWGHRIPIWTASTDAIELDTPADFATAPDGSFAATIEGVDVAVNWERDEDGERFLICVPWGAEKVEAWLESKGFAQDPDVLDTWFSSGLWPLSTMGWPDPSAFPETIGLLDTFNPTSVLSTAREIITLWVSRMVMFNRYFNNRKVPFRDVFIHAMIQDGHGQKMSKSLGNGVDPRDIVHSHGADALRFTLVKMATSLQDVRLPVDMVSPYTGKTFKPSETRSSQGYLVSEPVQKCPETGKPMVSGYGAASGLAKPSDDQPLARNTSSKFDEGRNFCNKLWNASRFALSNVTDDAADGSLALIDRWILARLHEMVRAVEHAVETYSFSAYADAMYDFIWRDFCDWYLEGIKPTVKSNRAQQRVLCSVLNAALRMLHPICPFVTEALWPHVAAALDSVGGATDGVTLDGSDLLAAGSWPTVDGSLGSSEAIAEFARVQELTGAIRNIRSENKVKPKRMIAAHVPVGIASLFADAAGTIEAYCGIESVSPIDGESPQGAVPLAFEGAEMALSGLVDAVDVESERARLTKLIEDLTGRIRGFEGRLGNENYVKKAPEHLVEETRGQLAAAEADRAAAQRALDSLE